MMTVIHFVMQKLEKNNLDIFQWLARNNPVRTLFLKGSFFGFWDVMGNRFPFCVGYTLFPFDPWLQTAFGHFLSSSSSWSQPAFSRNIQDSVRRVTAQEAINNSTNYIPEVPIKRDIFLAFACVTGAVPQS